MQHLIPRIQTLAAEAAAETIALREHLHANPELSFQEFNTVAYVTKQLQELGLQTQPIANTGVVALIEGRNPSVRTVALRADMDALPITEQNEVAYKSTNPGVMHACGHDVHTSSLLGTARILTQLRDEFEGTVKLMFQPGEELLPGGASLMIKEGVLENPKPASVLGQHVFPRLPAGKIGVRAGRYMASTDELYLTVRGKGGHGAMPEQNIDPVLVAAHIIVAAQQIVSRRANPKLPSVLSFGKVIAQGATNVIPNEVYMEGTFRTLNEEWRNEAHEHLRRLCEGLAESMGATCELEIRRGYPYLENEPELTSRVEQAAIQYLGAENVVELDQWMAAEDFAYFSQAASACFYRLGTAAADGSGRYTSSVHTPTFDIDTKALETGPGLMAWLTLRELAEQPA
ncbi:amidohydrolase [Hymenobacter taeanensis]|uniref:Amidohydrolase n=1 Tax=Hymenobacter taeanensis TaxID=2735321 RepID=A0A6M6BE06_9BACT|nr:MULTISPECIES: M20 family metallopeptidase [Hymenobacter]QJX46098.1 amidohydrolase [Hymenobacter taeanensis]UOQ79954.1 M20 family metallopeptidase [Hymenobacter sp. 5414T-23]